GTVICGDTYFNENLENATEEVITLVASFKPDLLIAGPAFNAGRYGMACGAVCAAIQEKLKIPVVTGMYEENPGADMYKKEVYIVKTGNSAAQMRTAVPALARLATRLVKGEVMGSPAEEGYLARGIRKNIFHEQRGSARAVEMLLKKLKGEPFTTEYPMP
ncbi:MAG TPA: glycine/betaine/sarcosine/D-proline family reductase selenoprotein B, partial [Syntrophomonas sp.]|nr:glycine/betaine/sarcosine/D-proline family reductase selenoprotein B [Syntrophomonas sp.]